MCHQLEPETVLCYCNPFDEMLDMAEIITLPYEGIADREKKHLPKLMEVFAGHDSTKIPP